MIERTTSSTDHYLMHAVVLDPGTCQPGLNRVPTLFCVRLIGPGKYAIPLARKVKWNVVMVAVEEIVSDSATI